MTAHIRPIREGTWFDTNPVQAQRDRLRGAWQDGFEVGEREGFKAGTRWGWFCGATAGVVFTAIVAAATVPLWSGL